jgi:coenzyme F420 hydrogenase subunit beta
MCWNTAGYLVAEVDRSKCTDCGLCLKVCPSVAGNQVVVADCDSFHGVCLSAYIGHACDPEIRQKSQSGGATTALLAYLLDSKQIDGAIVNRFCAQTKRPEVIFATSRDELVQAAGSYYCQSSVVQALFEHQKRRSAAVVLGCQAESLALLRHTIHGFKAPEFVLGLICAGQYSSHYIDRLIDLSRSDAGGVSCVRFRDKSAGGWPGNVKVYASSGDCVLDKSHRHRLKPIYEAYRCLLCFDQMNSHSDIVLGDPWGVPRDDNISGNTVLIARTSKGQHVIENAVAHGYIQATSLPVAKLLQGQSIDSRLKNQFSAAVSYCQKEGRSLPIDVSLLSGVCPGRPTRKSIRDVRERMRYSGDIYLARDSSQVAAYRERRERALKIEHAWKRLESIAVLPKRCLRWALKRIKR